MNLEILAVCANAEVNNQGMRIDGVFDYIHCEAIPFTCPPFYIALRLRIEPLEPERGQIVFELVDPDGRRILGPIHKEYFVLSVDGEGGIINSVFRCEGLRFERVGYYEVNVAVNGRMEGTLPLDVRRVAQNAFL